MANDVAEYIVRMAHETQPMCSVHLACGCGTMHKRDFMKLSKDDQGRSVVTVGGASFDPCPALCDELAGYVQHLMLEAVAEAVAAVEEGEGEGNGQTPPHDFLLKVVAGPEVGTQVYCKRINTFQKARIKASLQGVIDLFGHAR